MEEASRIVMKREMSQTRAERKREKGENMNEDDEGYLPASQDAAPTVRLYMVHMDAWADLSHVVSDCPKRL
jgi:hypothetical protein